MEYIQYIQYVYIYIVSIFIKRKCIVKWQEVSDFTTCVMTEGKRCMMVVVNGPKIKGRHSNISKDIFIGQGLGEKTHFSSMHNHYIATAKDTSRKKEKTHAYLTD